MSSMLPIIPMTALQRRPKEALASVRDYAVVQSHGTDRAFILHPHLGRVLLESGMLDVLRAKVEKIAPEGMGRGNIEGELKQLIGNVLRELSKK